MCIMAFRLGQVFAFHRDESSLQQPGLRSLWVIAIFE